MQGLVSEMQSSCPRCMAQGRLHLGNRPAPVHPGFYYFTILLLFYHDPSRCISETDLRRFTQDFTILLFCYFTISVLYYSTMYYFTVNYSNIYYSTTTPAVCISLTHLYRLYHKVCISETELCMLTPKFAFDSTTTPAVCISKTHLYRLYHKVCIAETELCMLTPKFAC